MRRGWRDNNRTVVVEAYINVEYYPFCQFALGFE